MQQLRNNKNCYTHGSVISTETVLIWKSVTLYFSLFSQIHGYSSSDAITRRRYNGGTHSCFHSNSSFCNFTGEKGKTRLSTTTTRGSLSDSSPQSPSFTRLSFSESSLYQCTADEEIDCSAPVLHLFKDVFQIRNPEGNLTCRTSQVSWRKKTLITETRGISKLNDVDPKPYENSRR